MNRYRRRPQRKSSIASGFGIGCGMVLCFLALFFLLIVLAGVLA